MISKGPWKYDPEFDFIYDGSKDELALFRPICSSRDDLALVTAAPELLEACKLLAHAREHNPNFRLEDLSFHVWNTVVTAIAKAEGR